MEFWVIPQLSRTIIECYSAGSDSDDCGIFSDNSYPVDSQILFDGIQIRTIVL